MPKRSIREKIISAQTVAKCFLQFHLRQFFFKLNVLGQRYILWRGRPFLNSWFFPTVGGVERQLWRRRGAGGLWDCDASRLQAGLPCTGLNLTKSSSLLLAVPFLIRIADYPLNFKQPPRWWRKLKNLLKIFANRRKLRNHPGLKIQGWNPPGNETKAFCCLDSLNVNFQSSRWLRNW